MRALQVKPGVELSGLSVEMVRALPVIMGVFDRFGVDPVITSGLDGRHSANSLHYVGKATDWRTRDLPGGSGGDEARRCAVFVREALNASFGDVFDVVIESTHLHVEYDPR